MLPAKSFSRSAETLLQKLAPLIWYGCLMVVITEFGLLVRWMQKDAKPIEHAGHHEQWQGDSAAYFEERPVPGGCLYRVTGAITFVPHPCAGSTYRAPSSFRHN